MLSPTDDDEPKNTEKPPFKAGSGLNGLVNDRGVKHLRELTSLQEEGYNCFVAFVIQMEGITEVRPNISTHPEFGDALSAAENAGVKVVFLTCSVAEDELVCIGANITLL